MQLLIISERISDYLCKVMEKLEYRDGRPEDSAFIAECILAGIGLHSLGGEIEDRRTFDAIEAECSRLDSLYSYRNVRIVSLNGEVLGSMLAYPGEKYADWRRLTWERLDTRLGETTEEISDYETEAGEYYLDTLAVMPKFRGHGYGLQILQESIDRARAAGYERITLIVEQDHPKLIRYYCSLGFKIESEMVFLGEKYYKCAL